MYHDNGVRQRRDGLGDAWADAHRQSLDASHYLADVDATVGWQAFAQNTGDRLFMEYQPDDYKNRFNAVRDFGIVALFDRKTSVAAMESGKLGRDLYLWQARAFSAVQPVPARFFNVLGGQRAPWRMVEWDIETGLRTGDVVEVDGEDWSHIWATLGLTQTKDMLKGWLKAKAKAA